MKLQVKGSIDKVGATEFNRGMFNAGIFSKGKLLGEGPLDENGAYNFTLDAAELPVGLELAFYPASVKAEEAGTMAIRRSVPQASIKSKKKDLYEISLNASLPKFFLDEVIRRTQKYTIHGSLYLQHPTYFASLAGCRIDFYEVDSIKDRIDFLPEPGLPRYPEILRRDDFLGSAYSDATGAYTFSFKFGMLWKKPGTIVAREEEFSPFKPKLPGLNPTFDYKPDIRARFSQFINGTWTRIYEAPMTEFDWNIGTDFHRDYIIPADCAVIPGSAGSAPSTGFRFHTIGLLPVDTTRIVGGYAFAQVGDPCGTFACHPFCATLRIYGLFAASHAVTSYLVETLKTDNAGNALDGETWQRLADSLSNLKWNDTTHRWVVESLVLPDGKFRNIDIEPENMWLEHSFKAAWNTFNCVDGYYKLRITGFNVSNVQVAQQEMPMVRIDNSKPDAYLDVSSPAATTCGDLLLTSDRTITFRVTAHHAQGHMNYLQIWGNRGRYAETAGESVTAHRPDANAIWNGVINELEIFTLALRSTTTIHCATMAYGFHLVAQGLGTNGYGINLEMKRAYGETNLIVTEI
ncbi:hypothetical protein [uncultured Desulfobulbus sp.]|uniref:hypothetical protein n=1 Tax=uncultured Desulfobulbus sp. TaxID=239745 RepID=UPI0029C7D537|nr:hypothetical protein [uncultured Desulfobulbus sp.]